MAAGGTGAGRIYVVDDLPDFLELMEDVLSDEGYEVITYPTIGEAAAAAGEAQPDLIITDVRIGEESGLDLVDAIRSDPATRRISLLVVTAATMDVEERGGELLSAHVPVLYKPFDMAELLERVHGILQGAPSR